MSNSPSAMSSSPAVALGYDTTESLFEPDVVLPSQYLVPDECGLTGGERRLMAAILSDGVEAYIAQCSGLSNPGNAPRAPASDAQDWVEAGDDSYVFSFNNVCECLGINPDYLRLGLGRYIETVKAHSGEEGGTSRAVSWKKIRRPRKS